MKKFFVKTFGCKVNQLETQIIENNFINNGFLLSKNEKEIELLIINSCSVTEHADNKCIEYINKIKSQNPSIKIILTGCFAQLSHTKIKNVDLILGNAQKNEILKYFDKNGDFVNDIFECKKFDNYNLENISKTRAAIKIQDGCNNRCSYCTICLARGISRSDQIKNITDKINLLAQNGFKEVVLTGIHIGQWGFDFQTPEKLLDLLKEIEKTQIQRYRLSSLNPTEIDEELINFLSKSKKFCPHFHLSIQAICNKTLKNMNRKYSEKDCINSIYLIKKYFKLPFIGADIIVGFAKETNEDFEVTKKYIEELPFSQIHVFPYSKRENTPAFYFKEQNSETEKVKRAKIIRKLSEEKYQIFVNQNIGQVLPIIVEKKPDKKTGLQKGLTPNYLSVLIDCKKNLAKTIQNVKIIRYENGLVFGQILK